MRRAHRLLCAYYLSRAPLSSRTTLLSNCRPLGSVQYPFNRFVQSLSHDPVPPSFESSSHGDERNTALDCLKSAEQLVKSEEHENIEKALHLGIKALGIFQKSDGGWSFQVARSLLLLGQVSHKMKRYADSLATLNTCIEILDILEMGYNGATSEIGLLAIEANSQIVKAKNSVGKRWEALANLRRVLALRIRIFGPDHKEVVSAYGDLAEAYIVALEFKTALPLCLKLLEMKTLEFGANSVEVAKVREQLTIIYAGMEEYNQALEQSRIAQSIFDGLGLTQESVQMEIEIAHILIMLGQVEEATDIIKDAMLKVDKESELKAFLLVYMAKSLCHQQKLSDAKRCLEISLEILEEKESVLPEKVAGFYADISMVYESMSEFEVPLSLCKRAIAILRGHDEMHYLEGSISAHIGWLLIITDRVDLAVPYLESGIERLEGRLGKKNLALGLAYKNLSVAYLKTDQPEKAIPLLTNAKETIEETLGPLHDITIDLYRCFASAYGLMGSYKLAMEFQERVVDALERCGPNASEDLREEYRLRDQLRRKAQGDRSAVFPANSLPASLLLPKK